MRTLSRSTNLVLAVALAVSFLASPVPAGAAWYEGGTLHKASGQQWRQADAANRLATAGDIAAAMVKVKSMREARTRAVEMRSCLDAATRGGEADEQRVSELAAACALIMGW